LSSAAAASTRCRVAAETFGMSRSARDTVATDTPARAATSTMLAREAAPATRPGGRPSGLVGTECTSTPLLTSADTGPRG